MEDLKNKLNNKKIYIVISVGVILFLIICYFVFFNNSSNAKGVSYIKQLEKEDVETLDDRLDKKYREERNVAIENGTIDVWGLFDDYVIFGDSRVMGFEVIGVLPDNRVLAGSGHSINNMSEWSEVIKTLKPKNVYISYGVNDMGLNLDESVEGGYGSLYEVQINELLKIVPDANIYVNSIIPATQEAIETKGQAWARVTDYNKKLKETCEKNGWTFIDNDALASPDIYQPDGIHFAGAFYPKWGQNMINATK